MKCYVVLVPLPSGDDDDDDGIGVLTTYYRVNKGIGPSQWTGRRKKKQEEISDVLSSLPSHGPIDSALFVETICLILLLCVHTFTNTASRVRSFLYIELLANNNLGESCAVSACCHAWMTVALRSPADLLPVRRCHKVCKK